MDQNELGTWRLIEVRADPGDGSGTFQPVISSKTVTFETNGTMRLTSAFKEYLLKWQMPTMDFNREITFSVSAKLPCSGEPWDDAIKPEVVCDYENYGTVYLKFVVFFY